jgi:hypothetical protein
MCKKNIKKFRVGERINNDSRWAIKKIDLEKNLVVLDDLEYRTRIRYVYLENPDAKPSLYEDGGMGRYTDPYWYED